MSSEAVLVVQLAVGLVFLQAGVGKLRQFRHFVQDLSAYNVLPEAMAAPAGLILVILEMIIAVAHLSGSLLTWAVPLTLCVLGAFLTVVLVVLKRGTAVSCLCFGSAEGEPVSIRTVIRLGVLLAAEIGVLITGSSDADWLVPTEMGLGDLALAIACAGLALVLFFWVLAAPEFLTMLRSCRQCRAHPTY